MRTGPDRITVEDVVRAIKDRQDWEADIKRDIAKTFWIYDVASQRRPKRHRK
jgi:hypothetical protein